MSNYSVKLTKCGKCQFSLAHLPSGGGEYVGTCARTFGHSATWGCQAGSLGQGQGQRWAGRHRVGHAGPHCTTRAMETHWLGPREGREPAPRPDGQDAELLNYEY